MDGGATKTRLREQLFEKLRDDITTYETFRSHGKDSIEQMRLAVKATSEMFSLIQTYEIE